MSASRFVAERGPSWVQLEELVDRAGTRAATLPPQDLLRLGHEYRAAAADLALARRRYPGDPAVARLEPLVARARTLVYGVPTHRRSVKDWVCRGFWWRVREQPRALLASAVLLVAPMVVAGMWAHSQPDQAVGAAGVSSLTREGPVDADDREGFTTERSAALSGLIFTNNARVAFLTFAAGITGGIGSAFLLGFNGYQIGLLAGLSVAVGQGDTFFRLVVPHGVLELSLIVVAGAAGLRIGWALVHPGHMGRGQSLVVQARAAVEMALGCAVLLVPCGLVEGFVTPRALSLPAAVGVGVLLGGLFWTAVLVLGRPAPEVDAEVRPAPAP